MIISFIIVVDPVINYYIIPVAQEVGRVLKEGLGGQAVWVHNVEVGAPDASRPLTDLLTNMQVC